MSKTSASDRWKEGHKYFIKNGVIHHYPYARCPVKYTGENLYDDLPSGVKCDKCFKEDEVGVPKE